MIKFCETQNIRFGASRLALAATLGLLAQASPALAGPSGSAVVAGEASVSGDGTGAVTVTQSTSRAVINWNSFSVDAGEGIVFRQPDAQSVTANRVIGADPSRILGSLQANGRVILINRNGVVFGRDATVDAAGLVVSTHDLDQNAFMAGSDSLRFTDGGVSDAAIVVNGRISIRDAGLAAFVAPHVRNDGYIEAHLGRVALGSANGFTVDLAGDGLISFAPGDEITTTLRDGEGNAVNALVDNAGTIVANGGKVLLTASAARDIVNASVNVGGLVRADSVSSRNGTIVLSGSGAVQTQTGSIIAASGDKGGAISITGGAVALGGLIDASASGKQQVGGTIAVSTTGLLSLGGTTQATAAKGAGGSISYRAGRVLENSSAITDVRGLSDGGTISGVATRDYVTSGSYLADGLWGKGGRIDLTGGAALSLLGTQLSASGRSMGGLVRLGGPFQGGKAFDGTSAIHASFLGRWGALPDLPHAQSLFVGDSTRIDVTAARGAGGSAVLWSDKTTTMLGAIDARGLYAPGSVEVSSDDTLRYVALESIQTGVGGTLLLDPKNIVIGTTSDAGAWSYSAVLRAASGVPISMGLEASDQFGWSVSLNATGDRLAVGAFGDDGAGNALTNSSTVYLFSFSDTSFGGGTLQAMIGKGYSGGKNVNVSALGASDQFGVSVSLNAAGDRLAVGANGDDGLSNAVSDSGAAYLFSFSDTSFTGGTLEATIGKGYSGGKNVDVSALEASDYFGWSVSLNAAGDRLAVSAIYDDGAGNAVSMSGAVYLFSFSDASFTGGTLEATLGKGYSGGKNIDVSALAGVDLFGQSVSLNAAGNRLAVGANGDDGAGNAVISSGAAYLFSFSDTSFTGGTLEATLGKGYSGGKNVDVSSLETDEFGISVSLNAAGDRLAVGANGDDGSGNAVAGSGAVYLFSFSDTSFTGGTLQGLIGKGYTGGKNVDVSTLEANDYFGHSVSLNAAGNRLAVGADADDGAGNAATDGGAVYLFSFSDTSFTGGTLQATLGNGYSGGKNVDVSTLGVSDEFGYTVSLNAAGDRLAVGAYGDDGVGNTVANSGAVYLFSFSDTSFTGGTLQAALGKGYSGGKNVDMSGLEAGDQFGISVSLNAAGDRLAVGANVDDGASNAVTNSGAVYLFSFSDTNFTGGTQEAAMGKGYSGGKNVDMSGLVSGDEFGRSVSLNAVGDRLAVGANGVDGSVTDSGAVFLFSFSDTSFTGGTQEAGLGKGFSGGKNVDMSGLEASDQFGVTVSLNGTGSRLAVGALLDDGAGNAVSDSGAVYLFSFADTNFTGGTLQATLGKGYAGKNINLQLGSGLDISDMFGASVSLNAAGDRLAVGVSADDGLGNTVSASGAVYLFSFANTSFGGGTLQSILGKGYSGGKNVNVSTLDLFDSFGASVSLNATGDRLAVGANSDDGSGNAVADSGAVYLFSFADTYFTGGTLEATIGRGYSGGKNVNVSAVAGSDLFGRSVSLNAAGDRLAVGAYGDDGPGDVAPNTGAAYLFSFSDTSFSGGTLEATIGKGYSGGKNVNVSALAAGDYFGWSVSLNAAGDRLAVTSPYDDGSGDSVTNSGAAYLFSFSDTSFTGGTLEATVGKNYSGGKNVNVSALEVNDYFGWSVSLNAAGDRLAVGATNDDGSGNTVTNSGAVYLVSFSDASFTGGALTATLGRGYSGGGNVDVSTLEASDSFGWSVAFNAAGDRLAVGASDDDGPDNSLSSSGAVYLFAQASGPATTFADNASGSTNISAASIATTLAAGTNMTLQASNDITLNTAIAVTGTPGSVGGLTLQAGRSVLLNANITTQGGAVSLIANETAANGVINAQRDAGAAAITMAAGTQIDAGTGAVSIRIDTGAGLTNTTSGQITLGSITGSTIYVRNEGPTAGSGVELNSGAVLTASGTGTALQLIGKKLVNNAGANPLSTPNGNWLVWSDNPANDTLGGLVFDYKEYAKPWSQGATTSHSGKGLLYAYAPSLTAALGASSKSYDSSDSATPVGLTLSGALAGDVVGTPTYVSALYDTKNAGTGKTVTVSGITASITSGGKPVYGYTVPTSVTNTASEIIAANLAITGVSATDKAYDGGLVASLTGGSVTALGNDVVTLVTSGASGAFATKNVGTGKSVSASGYTLSGTDAGNYALVQPTGLTANITAATLAITGVSAANKAYDGGLVASLTGGSVTALGNDVVTLVTSGASGAFATKSVGTGKSVSASGYTLSGTDAGNYALVQPTGLTANITAATLAITGTFTASNKVYDGNTSASINISGLTLGGLISGDNVQLAATGSFADKNVGTGKTVSLSAGSLLGTDADNYALTGALPTTTANITRLSSVTWTGAGGDGNWFNPANWAGGAVPDLANVANVILPNGTNVTFGAGPGSPVQLDSLNGGGAGGASLSMTGGALDIATSLTLAGLTQSGGAISGPGSVTVAQQVSQSGGSIAMGGNVSLTQASGNMTLNSVSGHIVTLSAAAGTLTTGTVAATGTLTASASGNLSLGRTSVGGNLSTTSTTGSIGQTGPWTVAGTTTLSSAGNITLANPNNALAGAVNATSSGGNVSLTQGTGTLILGTVSGGTVTASATSGAVNTTGPVSATGNLALSGSSGISLGGTVTSSGTFSAASGTGAIIQTGGTVSVAGTSSLTAAGAITLNRAGNAIVGAVTTISGTGQVTITGATDLEEIRETQRRLNAARQFNIVLTQFAKHVLPDFLNPQSVLQDYLEKIWMAPWVVVDKGINRGMVSTGR